MSILTHTIESPDGATPAHQDRAIIGVMPGVANLSGSAGVTVSTTVTLPASANLPANYGVLVNPGQGCGWYVDTKTFDSFVVHLVPFANTLSVAAGAFDVLITA